RPNSLPVQVDGACAALRQAAAKLRSGEPDDVPDDPQQRHVRADVDVLSLPVDGQGNHGTLLSCNTCADYRAGGRIKATHESARHEIGTASAAIGRASATSIQIIVVRVHVLAIFVRRSS